MNVCVYDENRSTIAKYFYQYFASHSSMDYIINMNTKQKKIVQPSSVNSRLAANADKKMNPSGGIDGFRKLENVVKF